MKGLFFSVPQVHAGETSLNITPAHGGGGPPSRHEQLQTISSASCLIYITNTRDKRKNVRDDSSFYYISASVMAEVFNTFTRLLPVSPTKWFPAFLQEKQG